MQLGGSKSKTKLLIVVSVAVSLAIIIVSIILAIMKEHEDATRRVIMDTYPASMPEEIRIGLGEQLKNLLIQKEDAKVDEVIKGVIRNGTYEEAVENDITSVTFLVDIDAYKQTYAVAASWSDKVEISDAITITCPNKEQSNYPTSFCKSMYNTTRDVENIRNNPLYSKLPIEVDEFDFAARRAVHYEIRGKFNDDDRLVLVVVDYGGGQLENAKNKIKELGYEPSNYIFEYYDDSGGY